MQGEKSWTFLMPTKIEFGPGSLDRLPDSISGLKRGLILTGRSAMRKAGVTDKVVDILKASGIEVSVYENVSPNPDCTEVAEAAAQAREFGADFLIGLGGGSVMDAAKGTAVAATHEGPIMEYQRGGTREVTVAALPLVAITSTSGTGSHVNGISVLSDRDLEVKRPIVSPHLNPRVAICDPEILRTMPPEITAATGFDAFAHALESYLSTSVNRFGDLCSEEAIRIIGRCLPSAVRDGNDLDLRCEMAWADTMGGYALALNGVMIPHVIAMVLGGRYDIQHGPAIASVMVACMKHSRPGAVAKLARVARLLGCEEASGEEALADRAIELVQELMTDIDLTKTVTEYGVPEADLQKIAEETYADFAVRVDADPVPTKAEGLRAILTASSSRD